MKVPLGELPATVSSIGDPEGVAFQELIEAVRVGNHAAGVHLQGGKVYGFDPGTTAHELFGDIITRANADIAIAILGQDGTTERSTGVYAGPAFDKVRDDLTWTDVLDEDLVYQTAVVAPYAAVNHGEDVIPMIETLLPRPELDARRAAEGKARAAHSAQLVADRGAGIDVDQPHSDAVARGMGLPQPYPRLAPGAPAGTRATERVIVAA